MNHDHLNWGIIIKNGNNYDAFYVAEGTGCQTMDSVKFHDRIPIIEWAFSLKGEQPAHYIGSESDIDTYSVYSYYFIRLDNNVVWKVSDDYKYIDQEFGNKLLSMERMFIRITCPELRDLIPITETTYKPTEIK